MRFIKKPIEIEAVEVEKALAFAKSDWDKLPIWLKAAYEAGTVLFVANAVEIVTLKGTMRGERGDWIIQGIKGELYPCKGDVFTMTYEKLA